MLNRTVPLVLRSICNNRNLNKIRPESLNSGLICFHACSFVQAKYLSNNNEKSNHFTIQPSKILKQTSKQVKEVEDFEKNYEKIANETLESLTEKFDQLADELIDSISDDFDVTFSNGVLNLKLGNHLGTYVINKQTPNLQIWLSSPTSGPKRFDFDFSNKTWIYKRTGETLHDLLAKELSKCYGKSIDFTKCSYSRKKNDI